MRIRFENIRYIHIHRVVLVCTVTLKLLKQVKLWNRNTKKGGIPTVKRRILLENVGMFLQLLYEYRHVEAGAWSTADIHLFVLQAYLTREYRGHGPGGERILSVGISGTLPLWLTIQTLAVIETTAPGAVQSEFLSTLRPRLLGNLLTLQQPCAAPEFVCVQL